jgi:hypothetical protein
MHVGISRAAILLSEFAARQDWGVPSYVCKIAKHLKATCNILQAATWWYSFKEEIPKSRLV